MVPTSKRISAATLGCIMVVSFHSEVKGGQRDYYWSLAACRSLFGCCSAFSIFHIFLLLDLLLDQAWRLSITTVRICNDCKTQHHIGNLQFWPDQWHGSAKQSKPFRSVTNKSQITDSSEPSPTATLVATSFLSIGILLSARNSVHKSPPRDAANLFFSSVTRVSASSHLALSWRGTQTKSGVALVTSLPVF